MSSRPRTRKVESFSLSQADMQWWREARFGLFIHWGLYALEGKGEWLMWDEQIPYREYRKLADRFRPASFDAGAWARTAKAAGAKYMVLTARHHDGFCLFDSQASDFTSVKTAARRDFIAEYVKACRGEGLAVGLYYSPLDWRFPGYFFPKLYRESAEAMAQQAHDQVRELLTNYGKIDILWFDGGGDDWLGFGGIEWCTGLPGTSPPGWRSRDPSWSNKKHYQGRPVWQSQKLFRMIRSLGPKIVINDRGGSPEVDWGGDFSTAECRPGQFSTRRAWEACDTLAFPWGYTRGAAMRSTRSCVQLLVNSAVRDGNLLLNTGPMADGRIEPRQEARLLDIGRWLGKHGQSIYATRGGPCKPTGTWNGFTHEGNKLYVHVTDWQEDSVIVPPAPRRRIVAARCLTARKFRMDKTARGARLSVGPRDRQAIDTIFELEYDGLLG